MRSMKSCYRKQTPRRSMLRSGAARHLLLWRVTLCAILVCSCNRDAPTAARLPAGAAASLDEGASIYPLSADDPGINPNDTWVRQVQTVAETTTVSSDQPFDDPNTGAPVTNVTVGSTPQTVN